MRRLCSTLHSIFLRFLCFSFLRATASNAASCLLSPKPPPPHTQPRTPPLSRYPGFRRLARAPEPITCTFRLVTVHRPCNGRRPMSACFSFLAQAEAAFEPFSCTTTATAHCSPAAPGPAFSFAPRRTHSRPYRPWSSDSSGDIRYDHNSRDRDTSCTSPGGLRSGGLHGLSIVAIRVNSNHCDHFGSSMVVFIKSHPCN
jgi:hypothetical protein